MLVYIHVPFCRSRCRYCAFHSLPLGPASPDASPLVAAYRDHLLRELDLWAARLEMCIRDSSRAVRTRAATAWPAAIRPGGGAPFPVGRRAAL